jgi:hypothetical protein
MVISGPMNPSKWYRKKNTLQGQRI